MKLSGVEKVSKALADETRLRIFRAISAADQMTCSEIVSMRGVTRGETLIKATYEAIRNSPLWNTSLIIITWDEHGGFYDHVPPPTAAAPGDTAPGADFNQYGFTFQQYGPRVPALVISPLIPAHLTDRRVCDHASVPATLEAIFGLAPFDATRRQCQRSAAARLALDPAGVIRRRRCRRRHNLK